MSTNENNYITNVIKLIDIWPNFKRVLEDNIPAELAANFANGRQGVIFEAVSRAMGKNAPGRKSASMARRA